MATMNIKDPEVHRMAKELAARRHTTVTGAVRDALSEALDRDSPEEREARFQALMEIARRSGLIDEPVLTDDDIYDEHGLPK